jgi:hypothetical protein
MGLIFLLYFAYVVMSIIGGCIWILISAENRASKIFAVVSAILVVPIQLMSIDLETIYNTIGDLYFLYYLLVPILIGMAVYNSKRFRSAFFGIAVVLLIVAMLLLSGQSGF